MSHLMLMGVGPSSGSSGATVLLKDLFTDADTTNLTAHTMDVGSGWTAVAGAITIVSNQASSTGASACYSADAGIADVTMTVDVITNNTASWTADAVGRVSNNSNFWLMEGFSDQTFKIYEKNAGAFTQRASAACTIAANTTYTMTVIFTGQTISATLNTVNISYGSAALNVTNTKFGLNDGGRALKWDNFLVTT